MIKTNGIKIIKNADTVKGRIKMVKIYKNTCVRGVMMAEQGTGFSLEPWGCDTNMMQGYDDGGKNYILPDNYEVCALKYGGTGIFHGDIFCDILTHSSSRPQLFGGIGDPMPVLMEAKNEKDKKHKRNDGSNRQSYNRPGTGFGAITKFVGQD